jgi:G2/mitotic-specific cyclin 2
VEGALLEEEEQPESEELLESRSGNSLQVKLQKGPVWPDLDHTVEQECVERIKMVKQSFNEEIDPQDTTMVSEYSEDILKYMGELEVSTMPMGDYIVNQSEITW